MKEARKSLIRTGLIWAAALLGLFAAQSGLMVRAYHLESAAFRQNVQNALASLVQKLENRETIQAMYSIVFRMGDQDSSRIYFKNQKLDLLISEGGKTKAAFETGDHQDKRPYFIRTDTLWNDGLYPRNQKVTIRAYTDSMVHPGKGRTKDTLWQALGRYTMDRQPLGPEALEIIANTDSLFYKIERNPKIFIQENGDSIFLDGRRLLVEKMIDDLQSGERRSVMQRIETANLDSLVNTTLLENGIHTRTHFGVYNPIGDSLLFASEKADQEVLKKSHYRTRLFPHDVLVGNDELILTFPREKFMLFKQLSTLGLTVLVFLIVIIAASASLFRRALGQQRFSRILIDFINNMTHEFKTPISTISLVSENLLFSGVPVEAERLNRYGQIIQDESRRMRGQVEKILQMASLEQGDAELKMEPVDVHALIQRAVENLSPQVHRHQGRFRTRLKAASSTLMADHQHLSNMLYNLLDNAIKYTPESPDILIETNDDEDNIIIAVKDNGIGLTSENAARVFDKYFRVHTGNVHNVKGFGLGLAYVALMARAHGGSISVRSQPGMGSTFTLSLPKKAHP